MANFKPLPGCNSGQFMASPAELIPTHLIPHIIFVVALLRCNVTSTHFKCTIQ